MKMGGQRFVSGNYRFAFQGQEAEKGLWGGDASFFKYRMSDNRIGRFFAVDPLSKKYPHYTPYSFSGNKLIAHVEFEGLEEVFFDKKLKSNSGFFHAFALARTTDAGIIFAETLRNQTKYNVMYVPRLDGGSGRTQVVNDYKDFMDQKYSYYKKSVKRGKESVISSYSPSGNVFLKGISDTDAKELFDKSKKPIIFIAVELTIGKHGSFPNFSINNEKAFLDMSETIVHEEDAHALNLLNGITKTAAQEHSDYFNIPFVRGQHSPSTHDLLTKKKFKNSKAARNLNQLINNLNKMKLEWLKNKSN